MKSYKYQELSKSAKRKALKEFRDSNNEMNGINQNLNEALNDILINGNYRFYKNGDFATIVQKRMRR